MGREVRRVPPTWKHPKNMSGNYQPMFDENYVDALEEWISGYESWKSNPRSDCPYWEYEGGPPDPDYYRQEVWTDEQRTHFQMYEDTSEGTPISPIFETPEELARWLADTGASSFAGRTASYEQWLSVCNGGWAPSAVLAGGELKSGVEHIGSKS